MAVNFPSACATTCGNGRRDEWQWVAAAWATGVEECDFGNLNYDSTNATHTTFETVTANDKPKMLWGPCTTACKWRTDETYTNYFICGEQSNIANAWGYGLYGKCTYKCGDGTWET